MSRSITFDALDFMEILGPDAVTFVPLDVLQGKPVKRECLNCFEQISVSDFDFFCKKTNGGNGELEHGDDFFLCQTCLEGSFQCYNCNKFLQYKELYDYFYFQPCGLDKRWFKNQDVKSNPYCSKCFTDENIYAQWMNDPDSDEEETKIYKCNECKKILSDEEYEIYVEKMKVDKDAEDEFALCSKCIDNWTCECCGNYMTYEEIEDYKFEPCGLDWQIFRNQDTEGIPHCADCYDKLKLEKAWAKQAGAPYKEWYSSSDSDSEEEEEEEEETYPPLPPSPVEEPKVVLQTSKKAMWDRPLTLDDLDTNVDNIPKTRIQEENVKYGMAYCAAETKDKSIAKLRQYLETHRSEPIPLTKTQEELDAMSYKQLRNYILYDLNIKNEVSKAGNKEKLHEILKRYTTKPAAAPSQVSISIQLDSDKPIVFSFPPGKSKKDLIALLYTFFHST